MRRRWGGGGLGESRLGEREEKAVSCIWCPKLPARAGQCGGLALVVVLCFLLLHHRLRQTEAVREKVHQRLAQVMLRGHFVEEVSLVGVYLRRTQALLYQTSN